MAIFRNGELVSFENEQGATTEELTQRYRQFNAKRIWRQQSSAQSGGKLNFGTPRLAKCRDLKVDGKRIK